MVESGAAGAAAGLTEARTRSLTSTPHLIPPLPFSFSPPPPPPPPPLSPAPLGPAGPRLRFTHLPLLFLPGRVQQQVPVPVILLLHVGLDPAGRALVISSVIIYHVSTRKPECATDQLSAGERPKIRNKTGGKKKTTTVQMRRWDGIHDPGRVRFCRFQQAGCFLM